MRVFAGAEGSFTLYEDDNETCGYEKGICVRTHMYYEEDEQAASFTIDPAEGDRSLIPAARAYTVELTGFRPEAAKDGAVRAFAEGKPLTVSLSYNKKTQAVEVSLPLVATDSQIRICLSAELKASGNLVEERCFDFLNQAEIDFGVKDQIYRLVETEKRIPAALTQLNTMDISQDLREAVTEILTAKL